MRAMRLYLFGRFRIVVGSEDVVQPLPPRARDLFTFLLVHRSLWHARDALADQLCQACRPLSDRKYLRQALWQLQRWLGALGEEAAPLLMADADHIGINPDSQYWLDTAEFEAACAAASRQPAALLPEDCAAQARRALELYRGDLLEGCYHDWCLFERERLQNLYLGLLDRLIVHCEHAGHYDDGLAFAERVLRIDHAHERTYQQLMRLHSLRGDRAAAMRQFERCSSALQRELQVAPCSETLELYEQLRAGRVSAKAPNAAAQDTQTGVHARVQSALTSIERVQSTMADLQEQLAACFDTLNRLVPPSQK